MTESKKCSHKGCSCIARDGSDHCSEYCKEAAAQDITELRCDCGHDGCA